MDEDVDGNIKTFETILKTYSVSKSLLYNDIINKEMSQILKSEDVIKSISRQIQDMNCIENHTKAFTNKINAYKESRLMCINNMLPLETQQKHLVPSTFDNHCGYDTQLLLATKDAEALTSITGVTQEFDTSFDQKLNSIISHRDIDLNVDSQTIHSDVLKINVNSQHQHDDIQRDDSNAVCNTENLEDVTIFSSPILLTEKEKCQHNTSFLLESFEKFEAIAIPIVQENSDIEAVKRIIKYKILHDNKSQIKSEQIYKSESMQLSPILKLRTDQEQVERQTKSLNNEESFEEEVIFSSDEKTDSDHIEDLPLTCALQTSFYEQELVLDKTIYVGFQTASNKSIKVLTDSFTRAKSVLNDCYNITKATNSLSLSELVEVYDSASREKEIIPTPVKSKSSNATCTITGRNDFNDKIISCDKENKLYSHDRDIFSETKKEDICTEEHIKIDDYIMQEFEDNMCIDDNKLHTNLRVSNKSVILDNDANVYPYILNTSLDEEQNKMCSKEIQTKNFNFQVDKKLFLNEYQTDKTNNTAKEVNQLYTVFKTASNKCIDISEAALVKSIKILDESNFQSSLIIDECNNKIYDTNNVINKHFQGYTTASNKPISISDEAYAQSKKVLQEIQSPFVFKDKSENYNEKENADETPNARDLSKGMNNNDDIHFGFKTASNIPINVSKEALLKSKFFLQEFEYDNDILINNENESVQILHNPDFKDEFCVKFESASSNLLHIPESEYCRKKKSNLDEVKCLKQEFNRLAATKNAFQGFETSNNNQVVISDQALEKSKKIFLDIGDCNNSDLEIVKDQKQEIKRLTSIKNAFQGFKTASNNPVVISDEALKKSKKIFQDIDDCDSHPVKDPKREFSRLTSITNAIQGFKIASNNPVVISDEALKKCKKIFQNIYDSNDGDSYPVKHPKREFSRLTSITNAFQGFKTASNNPVVISDEALKKSKKVFQDIGDYNNYNPETFKIENNVFIEPNAPNVPFQGFKTAGNNPVKISSDALKRSKRLFQDIDDNNDFYMRMCSPPEKIIIESTTLNDIDFQTVKNKPVNLFEEALKTGKIIIEDVDSNLKSKIKQKLINGIASRQNASVNIKNNFHEYETHLQLEAKKSIIVDDQTIKNDDDVSNIINTEVIQHFNETMLTEEFLDKSPNKRPASPILSCPKAKKMKTKYPSGPVFEGGSQPIRKINKFIFNNDYKKYKKYKLLDVYAMERNLNTKQSCNQVNYNIVKISSLEFVGARNEISNSKWTNVDIKKYFLELVNKNIIPNGWIENHIKLVTLKLFSYEKRFPNAMQNVCSVSNVLEQLKYRYEREVYNVERPALRKILEKDEVPSRRMVLQVLDIYKDGVSITNTLNSVENVELLLSDGWYYVKATIDKMLTKLICEDKITNGTKLVIHGAELLNCEQGIPPWEDTSLVRLKIFGNSTRRAHWTAKLGFHGNGAILSHLTAVKPEGGKISQLRVVVTRVYPMLYVEKFDDGSTVTRSERLENLYQMKHEAERETLLEKIYEEVEREFCMQVSQCDTVDCDRKGLESGSQIYQLMQKSRDPAEFRAGLTHSQATLLRDYVDKRREVTLQDMKAKVQSVLKKRGLNVTRNVVAMLKIRVADVYKQNVTKAMITVWRPHESLLHLVREGAWLDIYNIVPTGVRYSEIQISAGKQSLFRKSSKVNDNMLKIAKTLQRKCYLIEELTLNPYMSTEYSEVDLVGFVFDVQPSVQEFDCKKQLFQNVFVADVNKRIICINFWGGLKKFGFENILEVDQVIACVNLQKRSGNTRKNIPQYRATEFTIFTKTPRGDECRKKCEELSKQVLSLDRRKFTQDCILLRNNLVNMKYGNIENISPYRFNNSDCNLSKNKVFINSDLNLNGLDFDSTFKQSDTLSPKALLRKKDISERIAKLRKYGDPPPLSTIHIVNKNKDAVKPYRSPLLSNVEFKNNQPTRAEPADKPQSPSNSDDNLGDEKSNKCPSPVLPYKRTVNPVRLNFTKQNNVSKDDPFGEDFETSPPLSLD